MLDSHTDLSNRSSTCRAVSLLGRAWHLVISLDHAATRTLAPLGAA